MRYAERLKRVLSSSERRIFSRLISPSKIQNFLDTLPINFELRGETYRSPRALLAAGEAHCFEGALFAAAALAFHGEKPLLLDLQTAVDDVDHVVALFRRHGRWGAISKTNHAALRYRDAVYKTPRELAMSYFHEYFRDRDGLKTLRAYSLPFDLTKYDPEEWITAEDDLFSLVDALDSVKHFSVASRESIRLLRRVSNFERITGQATEWKPTSRHGNRHHGKAGK